VRLAHRIYETRIGPGPAVSQAHALAGVALFIGAAFIASRMGRRVPAKLGEGAIVGTSVRLAGISVEEVGRSNDRIEQVLMAEFPDEIEHIWTAPGTAEVATDPMGVELADFSWR